VIAESEVFRYMQEAPCMWFEVDEEHCSDPVMLTPFGPMCVWHQKYFWRAAHR